MLNGLELFRRVAMGSGRAGGRSRAGGRRVKRRRMDGRLPRMGVIVGVNHYGVVETVGVREQ